MAQLREVRRPGEVSRTASAQNSDREKETRIRAISFHHALTSLENVFLFSKTPAIYGLLRSYRGSSLGNSLRWQAISSWESVDLREIGDRGFLCRYSIYIFTAQAIILRSDLFYEYSEFLQTKIIS